MHAEKIELNLTSRKIVRFLFGMVTFLILAHFGSLISKYYFGYDNLVGLVPLFNLDTESNIPTLFSTHLLFLCSIFLFIISFAKTHKRQLAKLWRLLAVIFLFFAVDEFCSIHENFSLPLRTLLNFSGAFYFSWIIPYAILIAILAIVYFRFILSLPLKIRQLILSSGTVYIFGALGVEMIGGWYFELRSEQIDLIYELITTVEESLEMIGLVVFLYALIIYIETVQQDLTIQIRLSSPKSLPHSSSPQSRAKQKDH